MDLLVPWGVGCAPPWLRAWYTPNNCKIVVGFKMIEHRRWDWSGFGKSVNKMHIMHLDAFSWLSSRRIVEYSFDMLSFNNVNILIMNTYFPDYLASMFFQFILNLSTILQLGVWLFNYTGEYISYIHCAGI
jgi:hypothetical protein